MQFSVRPDARIRAAHREDTILIERFVLTVGAKYDDLTAILEWTRYQDRRE